MKTNAKKTKTLHLEARQCLKEERRRRRGRGEKEGQMDKLVLLLGFAEMLREPRQYTDLGEKVVVYCLSPVSLRTLTGGVSQRQDRRKSCQSAALKLYSLAGF